MLERIKEALETHRKIYATATEVFKEARQDFNENYIGNMLTTKMNEAQRVYLEAIENSRESNLIICITTLDDIRRKVETMISKPVPADFPATLEAIKVLQNPSKEELNAFISRYKGSYLAYRAICDAVGGAVKGFLSVKINDVIGMIEGLEDACRRCFYGKPSDYTYRLYCDGDALDAYDNYLTSFLAGDFKVREAEETEEYHDSDAPKSTHNKFLIGFSTARFEEKPEEGIEIEEVHESEEEEKTE